MIVLDTNVVSELMRPRPTPAVMEWMDTQPTETLVLSAVTVAELLHGVTRLPDGGRKEQLGLTVQALVHEGFAGRVLPFDLAAAEFYAELVTDREQLGCPISAADGQIAAICRAHRAHLATRNVRDFAETGVDLIDPWSTA